MYGQEESWHVGQTLNLSGLFAIKIENYLSLASVAEERIVPMLNRHENDA